MQRAPRRQLVRSRLAEAHATVHAGAAPHVGAGGVEFEHAIVKIAKRRRVRRAMQRELRRPLAWDRCVRPKPSPPPPPQAPAVAKTFDQQLVQFFNARLATQGGLVEGELWMQQGKIVDPQARFWQREKSAADCRIDCLQLTLCCFLSC